jgi:membrane associated rhomboid family serine protease
MRETPFRLGLSATVLLILANAGVYGLQMLAVATGGIGPLRAIGYLALFPDDLARGWVWQLLTFQFLHDPNNLLHLVLNCAMLYMFGRPLEAALGRASFLRLYFGSGTVGGLVQVLLAWGFPHHFGRAPVVGASAGVFGLVAAFAWLNRNASITTLVAFIIPVSMKAKYLLVAEAVLAVFGLLAKSGGIAHGAHLGGLLAGLAYAQFVVLGRPRFGWRRVRPAAVRRELVGTHAAGPRNRRHRSTVGSDDLPAADFISKEVDPILDKISSHGIQSLTPQERRILELARAKMNQR